MATTTPKIKTVSILDLPISHLAKVEKLVGARMTEWPAGVESVAQLYATVLAAGIAAQDGQDADQIETIYQERTSGYTMAGLVDLVELAQDGQVDADPT